MTEREFLERFINFVYYTENKSNWFLAIDNFLEHFHNHYSELVFVKKASGLPDGAAVSAFPLNLHPEDIIWDED